MILVLMGVSGIGKTTIGRLLASRTGWSFEDGDDYHPQENRRKMAAGIPLEDDDHYPWLEALHRCMLRYRDQNVDAIFACSALKQSYRELLSQNFAHDQLEFVYLHAPAPLVKHRIRARQHQYMHPDLLDSQIAALEVPEDAWQVPVTGAPEEAVQQILAALSSAPTPLSSQQECE
jgi:gluconokinase